MRFFLLVVLMRITVSSKTLLFEKSMKRSMQSKRDPDAVDISNLFTANMGKIMWTGRLLNLAWIVPIKIAFVVFMLYRLLDLAAFAGVAGMIGSILLNFAVMKRFSRTFDALMTISDARMKAVKEVFGAIQIIKFNAWEGRFLQRIMTWREQELLLLARYLYLYVGADLVIIALPVCVSMVSFMTYTLVLGNALAPPVGFFQQL